MSGTRAGKLASVFLELRKSKIFKRSPLGSRAVKLLSILGKSQAVRAIKRKHSRGACEQNANISAGVSLKISLFKQVLAQEQLLCHASCVSWCQTPGRRAALLLMEWLVTQEGASPGIPQCLPPALSAKGPGTCASDGRIASHLA